MKTIVGIDLGSTTTKAVLLDENSKMIRRGIADSRSNYADRGARRGRGGARQQPLTLFRWALNAGGGQSGELDSFLGALERPSTWSDFLRATFDDLEARAVRGQVEGERFTDVGMLACTSAARRGVQAPARGEAAPTVRRGRSAKWRSSSSATSPARATTTRPGTSRAKPAFPRSPAQCLRQVDHRRGEPSAGRRAQRKIPPRARRVLAVDSVVRTRSTNVPQTIVDTLAIDIGETYRSARLRHVTLPFSKDHIRSEILSTGWTRTSCIRIRARCSTSAAGNQGHPGRRERHRHELQMNNRFAAGCRHYLGYIADEMISGCTNWARSR